MSATAWNSICVALSAGAQAWLCHAGNRVDVDCLAGGADLIGSGCANDAAIAEFTRLRLMN